MSNTPLTFMKLAIAIFLSSSFLFSAPLCAKDDLSELAKNTDALYRSGAGAQDGTYTALASSMLAWGIGLSAVIAILASVLHQSTAHHNHNHAHCD